MSRPWVVTAALAVLALAATLAAARAAEEVEMTVSIKDHKFEPAELKVASGKAIKLTVNNLDATPEEFESKELGIRIKPLTSGAHPFVGEYHEDSAKGSIIAE